MDFPIVDLLDERSSMQWLLKHFHLDRLRCPHCQAPQAQARYFRVNRKSGVTVYRCRRCEGIYNLYSGTVFAGSQLTPMRTTLLLRGGQSSAQLAREIGLTEKTVSKWRQCLQANAERLQPDTPLPNQATESDEMFQNAGEKGDRHLDPNAPPRRRANKRRGQGTYAHDRPPILGTIGRASGQVRLRVVKDTTGSTVCEHVHRFTREGPHVLHRRVRQLQPA